MRNARELELAAAESKRLGADAARAAGERELAAVDVARQGRRHGEATRVLAAATAEVDSARQVLTELAGIGPGRGGSTPPGSTSPSTRTRTWPSCARTPRAWPTGQQRAIGHLRRLLTDADTAARTLAEARRLTASLDAEPTTSPPVGRTPTRRWRAHGTELAAAVRGHLETGR